MTTRSAHIYCLLLFLLASTARGQTIRAVHTESLSRSAFPPTLDEQRGVLPFPEALILPDSLPHAFRDLDIVATRLADADADGLPDLFILAANTERSLLRVRWGKKQAVASLPPETRLLNDFQTFDSGGVALKLPPFDLLAAGDFNVDGWLDVALAADGASKLLFLGGDGERGFPGVRWVSVLGHIHGLAAGDFGQRDGVEDLLVSIQKDDCSSLIGFSSWDGGVAVDARQVLEFPDDQMALLRPLHLDSDHWLDLGAVSPRNTYRLMGRPTGPLEFDIELDSAPGVTGTSIAFLDMGDNEVRRRMRMERDGEVLHPQTGILHPELRAAFWSDLALPAAGRARFVQGLVEPTLLGGYFNGDHLEDIVVVVPRLSRLFVLFGKRTSWRPIIKTLEVEAFTSVRAERSWLNPDGLDDLVLIGRGGKVVLLLSQAPVITVNTTQDRFDLSRPFDYGSLPGPDDLVSMREALVVSEQVPGPEEIRFALSGSSPGYEEGCWRFVPIEPFPALNGGGLFVNGASQDGYAGKPLIMFDGSNSRRIEASFFQFLSGSNALHGVVINNCELGAAVDLSTRGARGNRVTGCYLGVDAAGERERPNWRGILISRNAHENVIGGRFPGEGNLISGAQALVRSKGGTSNTRMEVLGNLFGTNAAGDAALSDRMGTFRTQYVGWRGDGWTIGGPGAARNVFAVSLQVSGCNNLIQNNLFGLSDATSSQAGEGRYGGPRTFGTGAQAVVLASGAHCTVGGPAPWAGNTIAGAGVGVHIMAHSPDTSGYNNVVMGNRIGTPGGGNRNAGLVLGGSHGDPYFAVRDNRIVHNVFENNLGPAIWIMGDSLEVWNEISGNRFVGNLGSDVFLFDRDSVLTEFYRVPLVLPPAVITPLMPPLILPFGEEMKQP